MDLHKVIIIPLLLIILFVSPVSAAYNPIVFQTSGNQITFNYNYVNDSSSTFLVFTIDFQLTLNTSDSITIQILKNDNFEYTINYIQTNYDSHAINVDIPSNKTYTTVKMIPQTHLQDYTGSVTIARQLYGSPTTDSFNVTFFSFIDNHSSTNNHAILNTDIVYVQGDVTTYTASSSNSQSNFPLDLFLLGFVLIPIALYRKKKDGTFKN